ncbi:phage portal protein [Sansalvadorimonas verongulae]|uniref:phage portal protein n=1 Tax=Sansalvadorimonas verongulae TaxID=2172824 RepID=UPI0012BBDF52|nr:phage portal protein [Sansalvadorimonas verongulae]MTI12047.1 phage portal protein [Sansalvadorimonas verongulae]
MLESVYEKRGDPLENPANSMSDVELLDYIQSNSGIHVSEKEAMKHAAVYSCIYVLSSSLAQLPLNVMRKQGNKIEVATDHAAYDLLSHSPNSWQTSYDWREGEQSHVSGWGNAFTKIRRNKKGELAELYPSFPWATSLLKNGNRYVYSTYDEDFGYEAVQPEDMIHIRALGVAGIDWRMGKSPIRQHAETIGLGLAAQRYGSKFFESGGRATGLVTPKGALNKEAWGLLKSAWKAAKNTFRDTGGEILLPSELNYQAMTIPPEEAQFIDSRKMTRSEVAGIFNVPAHMINDLDKATFSNISEQAIQFVRHTMMPWVVKWEQELNRKLFTAAERRAGYYVKFNLAGLLRGTAKDRAEFYNKAITDGWMDRNEVRALEDLNPRDGLSELLISVNAVPASQIGNQQENPSE